MNLTGYVVQVQLSTTGQRELGSILNVERELEALVLNQDSVGLWISTPIESQRPVITLLKWEHFSTVSFEYQPVAPVERSRAGFQP